ncbi:ATP-binding protein [Reichenbachiella agarivorans]|uniref:histidine kinase n=1 Tax=Reichenbachiella agarivorans TaxID=2979464 RepID=A0ABY6CQM3_9BACT|nr:ATP-binding protein [Reichenbachiella agarivorans]UXP32114.1 ATP-binding protein [Reichenbachiella agarivorans]
MNTSIEYFQLPGLISSGFLIIAILIMFKINSSMHGGLYKTIWWTALILLLLFTYFNLLITVQVLLEFNLQQSPTFNSMQLCGSVFSFVVVFAGLKTTTDLKVTNISKRYLDKVMKSMSSYLIVTDSNFQIQKVNEALCIEMGIDESQLKGTNVSSIFFDCNLEELVQNYSEQSEAYIMSYNTELKSVMLTGEVIYRNSNEVDGYVFIAFNNYQKEITRLYSYFRSIFDHSEFAIITTDLDGSITGANPAAERYFEKSEEDMVMCMTPEDLHCTECLDEFAEQLGSTDESDAMSILRGHVNEGKTVNQEMLMRRKNNTLFPALITINAIKDEGQTIGYFEIIADLTEKKKVEEELRKVNKELKDFAHIVSHDLKAPLRAISSLSSWLQEDYAEQLGTEGQEQFKLINSRVSRMENLINGILEYSRVGRIKEDEATEDLNEIVNDVKDAIVPKENFEVIIEGILPSLNIDRTRTQQIFQNIISNAVKYMDKSLGKIQVACQQDNNNWTFSIKDNGPGIEKQYFEKIFQIFQTLSPRDEYESTGVGLAIVKKSVELYGGKVWLESIKNLGTTFFFTIPKTFNT